jgi:hypothetical protein
MDTVRDKTYTVAIEIDQETGDYLIPFSDELLEGLDWKDGDTIEWIDNKDGSWTLKKVYFNSEK